MPTYPKLIEYSLFGDPAYLETISNKKSVLNNCRLEVRGEKFFYDKFQDEDYIRSGKSYVETLLEMASKSKLMKQLIKDLEPIQCNWACHSYPDARSAYLMKESIIAVDNRLLLFISQILQIYLLTRQGAISHTETIEFTSYFIQHLVDEGTITLIPPEFGRLSGAWKEAYLPMLIYSEVFIFFHELVHLKVAKLKKRVAEDEQSIHSLVKSFAQKAVADNDDTVWIANWSEEMAADLLASIALRELAKNDPACAELLSFMFHLIEAYNMALVCYKNSANFGHPTAFQRLASCKIDYDLWNPSSRHREDELGGFSTITSIFDFISLSFKTSHENAFSQFMQYSLVQGERITLRAEEIRAETQRLITEILGKDGWTRIEKYQSVWP